MAESSSLSSPLLLKNVTVSPGVLELKKHYRFCTPVCTNRHDSIAFGDLADLQRINETGPNSRLWFHRSYRDFSLGNYSISVVTQDEAKPMVIFHRENFDPSLLATALLDGKDKNEEASAVEKCGYAFGAMDCTSSTPSSDSRSYKRSINNRQDANDENRAETPSELATSLNLVWKLDPTDAESSAGFQMPRLDDLFYFVNATAWFEHRTNFHDTHTLQLLRSYSDFKVEISALTDGIFQLQAINETIGIAINPKDVFGEIDVSSVVIQDSSHNCCAVLLHGFGDDKYGTEIITKESVLYENVYRSFYKFGEEIENPYYGNDEANEFARLPDKVFVKILLHLPWRQRMQCRRVNKRWRAVSSLAMAIDTKVIELPNAVALPAISMKVIEIPNERYGGMSAEDLNVVLPIVSDYLEEFIWRRTFNFEGIAHVQLFPKLRKLHIFDLTPQFGDFFSLLNNCPNLKELTAPIPKRPSSSNCMPGPYTKVEKLGLINRATLTDPWLIELTDYFPKLVSLRISGYEFLSSSCISAVVEKYGETLTRLEIDGSISMAAVPMIGAITGFGSCPYMEYLSLFGTAFISDPCMAAIAAGCAKLTTLDIDRSSNVTNEGLVILASLPNLKRLDISGVGSGEDLSFGIAQLAKAGHLEQLLVTRASHPSAACLKTCVRYCRQLRLIDISDSTADLTIDDAKEIIQLYGTWGLNSRLIFRSGNTSWWQEAVRTEQNEVTATFNRRFVVTLPQYRLDKKWASEDDSDAADNQAVFNIESDYEDEYDVHSFADSDSDDYDNYSYGEVDDSDFSG